MEDSQKHEENTEEKRWVKRKKIKLYQTEKQLVKKDFSKGRKTSANERTTN